MIGLAGILTYFITQSSILCTVEVHKSEQINSLTKKQLLTIDQFDFATLHQSCLLEVNSLLQLINSLLTWAAMNQSC